MDLVVSTAPLPGTSADIAVLDQQTGVLQLTNSLVNSSQSLSLRNNHDILQLLDFRIYLIIKKKGAVRSEMVRTWVLDLMAFGRCCLAIFVLVSIVTCAGGSLLKKSRLLQSLPPRCRRGR